VSELAGSREGVRDEVGSQPVPTQAPPSTRGLGAAPAIAAPGVGPGIGNILSLQRSAGNHAVARYLAAQGGGAAPGVERTAPGAGSLTASPGGVLLRDNGDAAGGANAVAQNPLALAAQRNAQLIRNRANLRLGSLARSTRRSTVPSGDTSRSAIASCGTTATRSATTSGCWRPVVRLPSPRTSTPGS
jgi:hypothetical protein